jgi:hypothetical protein
MRKLILALVLLVLVISGVAAVSLRSRVAAMAPEVGRQIAEKIGANVEVGDVDVSLFPLAAKIRDVRVLRERNAAPFLTIETVRVGAALLSLFGGKLDVQSVVAERPRIEILRDEEGRQLSELSEDLFASLAELPFTVEVIDGGLLIEDRTVAPPRRLRAEGVRGTVQGGVDGALLAKLEGSVLGSSDDSTLELQLKPDAGPTGGDHVTVDFRVKDGRADAVKEAFVLLREADLVDPLSFEMQSAGLIGEKSTESKPAEPMLGKLKGSMGVVVGGLGDRLEVDVETALDDSRYQVRRGQARWGGFAFEPTGWVTLQDPHKVSARLVFERFALTAAAERFGFEERWRPKGNMDLTIRATGTTDEVLMRHEGKIDALEFHGWPAIRIKATPVGISGALLSVNTDISASLTLSSLEVGTARLDQALVGLNYWKNKLTLSSIDAPFYDGTALGSVVFWPKTDDPVEGGLMLRNSDAETLLKNIAPRLSLGVYGRSDAVLEMKHDAEGLRVRGRAGIHGGRIAGSNWMRQLVAEALGLAGRSDALAPIAASAASTLADVGTRFDRLAIDFEVNDDTVRMPRVVVTAEGAEIRGRGEIAADGSVAIDGALLPEEPLSRALTDAAPALGAVKSTKGSLAVPFTLRAAAAGTSVTSTPAFRDAVAAAVAGKTAPALEIEEIPPVEFGTMLRLRKQFGR